MVGGASSRERLDPRVAVWVPGASSVPEHQLCEPIQDFLLKLLSPGASVIVDRSPDVQGQSAGIPWELLQWG